MPPIVTGVVPALYTFTVTTPVEPLIPTETSTCGLPMAETNRDRLLIFIHFLYLTLKLLGNLVNHFYHNEKQWFREITFFLRLGDVGVDLVPVIIDAAVLTALTLIGLDPLRGLRRILTYTALVSTIISLITSLTYALLIREVTSPGPY